MDFSNKVKELAKRSSHALQHALTEEATKTSVVLPLIQAFGFDVFNLEEVIPEFIADVGIKKGEKIDFALKIGGKIEILVEAKPISMSLGSTQYSQLYRYFSVVDARLAILTNGREIWFFSDIDERNKMDKKPFFIFDLQSHDEGQVAELARFQKTGFAVETILEAASNLKFVKSSAAYLKTQLADPSDDFVRLVGRNIYDGSLTRGVVEQLRPAIQSSLDEVIRDRIQDKLNVAFRADTPVPEANSLIGHTEKSEDGTIQTTEDEYQAFYIVRAIGARIMPVERITMRDAKSYCSIFVDDKNTRPVCRLYFNAKSVRRIGIFDADKVETRHDIGAVSDIYKLSEEVLESLKTYIDKK